MGRAPARGGLWNGPSSRYLAGGRGACAAGTVEGRTGARSSVRSEGRALEDDVRHRRRQLDGLFRGDASHGGSEGQTKTDEPSDGTSGSGAGRRHGTHRAGRGRTMGRSPRFKGATRSGGHSERGVPPREGRSRWIRGERPTWPCSAATCRRASAPAAQLREGAFPAHLGRRASHPPRPAVDPSHPDLDGMISARQGHIIVRHFRSHSFPATALAPGFSPVRAEVRRVAVSTAGVPSELETVETVRRGAAT